MLEITIATLALGFVTVGVLQATVALERSRRTAQHIDLASRELDNLMERLVHEPWEAITQQNAATIKPPVELTSRLPAVELETLVFETEEPIDTKRITMQLRWHARSGRAMRPLVLTAWVFREQEGQP